MIPNIISPKIFVACFPSVFAAVLASITEAHPLELAETLFVARPWGTHLYSQITRDFSLSTLFMMRILHATVDQRIVIPAFILPP